MAGIYIHIPFCKKNCFYCDFYKTTVPGKREGFLEALFLEMGQRNDYLGAETVKTIYFGGGTPTQIPADQTGQIMERVKQLFSVDFSAEITQEANPDDLTPSYLSSIHDHGINRLSIGIQSFSDEDLRKLNRRHTAFQAIKSVENAYKAGFAKLSVDLMYGIPGLSLKQWTENLTIATALPVNHISAYHLTYHEGTVFFRWLKNGKLKEVPEEDSIAQFERLTEITGKSGFEQYEISNFARNNEISLHNSGYWLGKKYLGLGPSAHSFNQFSRQWNVSDVDTYISSVCSGKSAFESELLTDRDKLNDYLITALRIKWGISLQAIRTLFGEKTFEQVLNSIRGYLKDGSLLLKDDTITLSRRGMVISDQIMLALLVE